MLALFVVLALVAVALVQSGSQQPSPSPSQSVPFLFDPQADASAATSFGEHLVVQEAGGELSINLVTSSDAQTLASYDLPDSQQFVVAHQLICADGTGPERSLIVFGATSPASVVGSLRMDLFDGSFTRTPTGLFLFVGSEPPAGGRVWELNRGLGTVVLGSVVLAGPVDPGNPPPAPCDDWDPTR